MRLEAVRYPVGLCVDCREYETISRLAMGEDDPTLDLENGWCWVMDCVVPGAHEPCGEWRGSVTVEAGA